MVCLGFAPWTAGWYVQTNPLSYGGPIVTSKFCFKKTFGLKVHSPGLWFVCSIATAQGSIREKSECLDGCLVSYVSSFFKNGPFPASFSLFSSFQYTADSIQMFDINKFFPMTGFKPRTSGIGSNRSTN